MRLSVNSKRSVSSGELVNIIQVNCESFIELAQWANMLWSAPLQIIITFLLLYYNLGYSAFAGLATLIVLVPINSYSTNQFNKKQIEKLEIKDVRIKIVNEILNGIKVCITL